MRQQHKLCLWRLTTRTLALSLLCSAVTLFVSPASLYADTQLFFDDFEDTTLSAWSVIPVESWVNGSSNAHSGTRKARVAGNVDAAVLQKAISTSGYTGVTFSFWHDTSAGWDSQDVLEAQWSADNGGNWNTVVTLDGDDLTPLIEGGEDWIEHTVTLPASANNNPNVVIRFVATVSGTTDIIFIDDVRIGGVTNGTQPTPTVIPTGVVTPTPTVVPTVTPVPTVIPTVQPTATPTPKATPTAKPTATVTPTPTIHQGDDAPTNQVTLFSLLRMILRLLFRNMFGLLLHF